MSKELAKETATPSDADLAQEFQGKFGSEPLRWVDEGVLCLPYIPDFLLDDVVFHFAPSFDNAKEVYVTLEWDSLERWSTYLTKKGVRFLETDPGARGAEGPFKVKPGGLRLEVLEGGSFFLPKPQFKHTSAEKPLPIVSLDKRRPFNPWKPNYIRALNFIKKYSPVQPISKAVEYCLWEIEECGEVSGSTSWENAEFLLTETTAENEPLQEVLADVFTNRPEDFPLGSEVYLRILGVSGASGFEKLTGLASHPHRLKRRHVATSLGKLGNPEGLSTLEKLLDDHEPEVREAALLAISRVGVSKADGPTHERIASFLKSDDTQQQVWAAAALYRGGDESQEKRLVHLVKDTDAPLYSVGELGKVLVELSLVQTVPFLIKRLRSERIELQDDAAEVLQALTGLDLEFHSGDDGEKRREAIKAWKNWWEDYKRNRKRQ